MLYNVLVGFVFAQLHYTTKRLLPFFFWMQPFILVTSKNPYEKEEKSDIIRI